MNLTDEEIKTLAEKFPQLNYTWDRMHVFVGEKFEPNNPEFRQRVLEEIEKSLIEIAHGNTIKLKNIDGPPWFPLPQIKIDDYLAKNWKYRKWKILFPLHNKACAFDRWYQWKIHKLKRTFK